MSLHLVAMTCGWLDGPLGLFLAGETGRLRVPVPSYLIVHPKGRVIFDTGLHIEAQSDAKGRLGEAGAAFTVDFEPGDEVESRLEACDVDASEQIRFLVNSHLHFDHSGGNAQIPNATLVVQRREWEAGRDADQIASNYFDPRDYDLGHERMLIDGEHDLFGDGSVVCLPTFGHTPGHQYLRVRIDSGDVVLAADSCYLRRTLEDFHLPTVRSDPEAMLDSLRFLRKLQERGARILFGHDPELWADLPQAPASLG